MKEKRERGFQNEESHCHSILNCQMKNHKRVVL